MIQATLETLAGSGASSYRTPKSRSGCGRLPDRGREDQPSREVGALLPKQLEKRKSENNLQAGALGRAVTVEI